MGYPIETYKAAAGNAFSRLLPLFSNWTNGWQVGNVFDTLTDYAMRYPDAEPSPNGLAKLALERWESIQGSMCWYDDYGWWGIASAKAFDPRYATVFGPYAAKFQAIALDCWNVMHTGKPSRGEYNYGGGPMVWVNRDERAAPGYFTSPTGWAAPRFGGGVWQYDMWAGSRTDPPECTPNHLSSDPNQKLSDPKSPDCTLGPYQNTVMNGLYLELALRLASSGQGSGTLQAAKSEMAFLRAWFEVPGDQSLLQALPDGNVLVRERVATYAEINGSYLPVEGYVKDGAWSGDQGLILGGLADKLLVDPSDPTNPIDQSRATAIARGVLLGLAGACGVKPYSDGFNDHGDADDYSCGSGVFWRYLLRAFELNTDVRSAVLQLVAADPSGNAVYVAAEKAGSPDCASTNELFEAFNQLAALLAAIEVLEVAN